MHERDSRVVELLATILGHYQDAVWKTFEEGSLARLTPEQTEELLLELASKQRAAKTAAEALLLMYIIQVVNMYTQPRGES